MPKLIRALDIFFEESESRSSWLAWFSVSWSDDSISSWSVRLPKAEELNLPGLADHEWIAGILAMAAKREVEPGDICVTTSSPNIATVAVDQPDSAGLVEAALARTVDKLLADGYVVQLPLDADVSRETDA